MEVPIDVEYVANLARINLSAEETELFQRQLAQVLQYVEKLNEIDVSKVESASHDVPIFNVFRADQAQPWFEAEQALANAPQQAKGLFLVTKVIE